MSNNKYKAILFDADNTLFDFDTAEKNALENTLCSFGINISQDILILYHEINASLWRKLEKNQIEREKLKTERFRLLLSKIGLDEKQAEDMSLSYVKNLSRQTCLIDGAEDICRRLSEKYSLYLVTNGLSAVQTPRFQSSKIAPYFKDIFISESIGYAKPAPEYFYYVIDRAGKLPISEYLVVGDSLTSDVAGANNTGIDVCYYNSSESKNIKDYRITYNIKTLSELADILL